MTFDVLTDPALARPIADRDGVSAPYFRACREGKLLIQACPECGHRQFYPRPLCLNCAATPEWMTASGHGTVHTYTVIRQMLLPPFKDATPYVVAMIDLDEGVRLMGNVISCDPEDVSIGMPVEVCFVAVAEDAAFPQWRPAAG
jgi:uncharacterized OB-fold protein